jgi:hypothetical protein
MKTILIAFAGAVIYISGCTASGPAFTPGKIVDANKAVVYLYRPFSVAGCALTPHVYIDEVKHGPLKNNGYLVYLVEPGKRMVELRDAMWDGPLTIYPDTEAGKQYYIRCTLAPYKIALGVIPEEYAIREIINTKKAE